MAGNRRTGYHAVCCLPDQRDARFFQVSEEVAGPLDEIDPEDAYVKPVKKRARCSKRTLGVTMVLSGLVLTITACAGMHWLSAGPGRADFSRASFVEQLEEHPLEEQPEVVNETCGLVEEDVEYHTKKAIYQLHSAFSAGMCCAICEGDPRCGAWTWGSRKDIVGLTDQCFLHSLAASEQPVKTKRRGVTSGFPSGRVKKHGFIAAAVAKWLNRTGVPQNNPALPPVTCPGSVAVAGQGPTLLVNAKWVAPGIMGTQVEVLEQGWIIPHLGSRAYFASNCNTGSYNHSHYSSLKLLGKTLRYTTDIAGAGCGCNAKLSLVPLQSSSTRSGCSDHYCDAASTCGLPCAEIGVQQANEYAWSTSLHASDDARGHRIGYGGGGASNGGRDWTTTEYGPGASCIDTARPFEVQITFPVNRQGSLEAVDLALSQSHHGCKLTARIERYSMGGTNALDEISEVLADGVTPALAYLSSSDLLWLDGPGLDGKGPCIQDAPAACPESVRFYNFAVEDAIVDSRQERQVAHGAGSIQLGTGEVERAVEQMLPSNHYMQFRKLELPIEKIVMQEETITKNRGLKERFDGAIEWEVVNPGVLNVRETKDLDGSILTNKLQGTFVVGQQEGQWVALMREPGFMRISLGKQVFLKKRMVSYAKLTQGTCLGADMHPILDASTCQQAGFALGYFDVTVGIYWGKVPRPEGCYLYEGQLWLATNAIQIGNGVLEARQPICSSKSYPTTTTTTITATSSTTTATTTVSKTSTTTITTSTITTITTTTWGWPSLFCISVVRTKGYELPLVREQQRRHVSIFTCDEYSVFSDGGNSMEIGVDPGGKNVMTIVIPSIKQKIGDLHAGATTDSWLNTKTFLQVWDLAKDNGKFEHHDWSVKVDPDAVFFPERLRASLLPHTVAGASMFVMNCDKYNPVALYGSLEIFSKEALKTYVSRQWACRNDLPWHGWGEDFFMSHCMDRLGVQRLYNFSLIGDKRCHYAPCTDPTKVVFHDYKGTEPWFQCYDLSVKAARPR